MYKNIKKIACKRHLNFTIIFSVLIAIQLISIAVVFITGSNVSLSYTLVYIGVLFILAAWQFSKYQNVSKSNAGKMLAKYYPERDLDDVFKQLEFELEVPQYETKQLVVTQHFVVGHVGAFRKNVVIPCEVIAGIYTCHEMRRGRSNADFYEVIIIDSNLKNKVLQLKNNDQMLDAAFEIKNICPNANSGTYEDFLEFGRLPKNKREEIVYRIAKTNKDQSLDV